MVKEILIPKENKAQVEEVRELENKDLEQKKDENKGSKVIQKLEETILPTAHASDDKEAKQIEGAKETIGTGLATTTAINPVVGGVAEGVSLGVGAAMEGIGKLSGEEDLEKAGNVYKEAPVQPLKEVKEGIKKIFE